MTTFLLNPLETISYEWLAVSNTTFTETTAAAFGIFTLSQYDQGSGKMSKQSKFHVSHIKKDKAYFRTKIK